MNWIIVKITTKCPKCGREYEDIGKSAQEILTVSNMECASCDFKGDLGQ
jgi:predicted RNA-binding Zn-ribbon protein involved in translation (DUF1610 family)